MRFMLQNYAFEENEVELLVYNRQRILGPRGTPFLERITLQVMVDQLRTGAAANVARYNEFNRVASSVSRCGFIDEAGNPTMIWLDGATSVSGLQFIQPPSIAPQDEVEFATHLSIPMGFSMDVLPSGLQDQIIDYEETFTFEDEGPTRVVPVETDTGPLEFYETCKFPPRYITQSGYAIGRDAPPKPNGPRLDAHMIQRVRGRTTPVKSGLRFIGYRVDWRYVFVVQEEIDFLPILR